MFLFNSILIISKNFILSTYFIWFWNIATFLIIRAMIFILFRMFVMPLFWFVELISRILIINRINITTLYKLTIKSSLLLTTYFQFICFISNQFFSLKRVHIFLILIINFFSNFFFSYLYFGKDHYLHQSTLHVRLYFCMPLGGYFPFIDK